MVRRREFLVHRGPDRRPHWQRPPRGRGCARTANAPARRRPRPRAAARPPPRRRRPSAAPRRSRAPARSFTEASGRSAACRPEGTTVVTPPSRWMTPLPPPGPTKPCTRSVPPVVATGPPGVSTTCPSERRGRRRVGPRRNREHLHPLRLRLGEGRRRRRGRAAAARRRGRAHVLRRRHAVGTRGEVARPIVVVPQPLGAPRFAGAVGRDAAQRGVGVGEGGARRFLRPARRCPARAATAPAEHRIAAHPPYGFAVRRPVRPHAAPGGAEHAARPGVGDGPVPAVKQRNRRAASRRTSAGAARLRPSFHSMPNQLLWPGASARALAARMGRRRAPSRAERLRARVRPAAVGAAAVVVLGGMAQPRHAGSPNR